MDDILSIVKQQFAILYLKDIIIFWRSVEKYLDHVLTVLGLLLRAGVSLKLKKCFFFNDRIDYLIHVMQPDRIGISTKLTDIIRRLRTPASVTELKVFLGH